MPQIPREQRRGISHKRMRVALAADGELSGGGPAPGHERVMARSSWASRWAVVRSVLRRSWPTFDSHELVRQRLHRKPVLRD